MFNPLRDALRRKLINLAFSLIFISATCGVVQADLAGWEAVISDANPLHWYKFDETSMDCIDSGSGGLNGTYDGVSLGQEGLFEPGTAVGFERTGANRANFTGATNLPGPWTVEYIVKTTKPPAGSDSQALHDSDTTSIRLAGWTSLGEAGFTLYGVADYQFTPATGLTLNDLVIQQDVWTHMVFRNNGSGTQLFFDGVLVGTSPDSIDLPRLRIGGRGAGPADHLMGVLDEAVVFDRALSDAEILAHATPTFPVKATNPDPQDGATIAATWANLMWTEGSTAASHDIYVGDDFDQVNEGTGDTFRTNQDLASTYYFVGFVGSAFPDGLIPGTTYYWRIDEVEADGMTKHKGDVWSFFVPPKTAYNPIPADGAEYVGLNVSLSWTGGFESILHKVHFGDDFDDVNNATVGISRIVATYDPGPLEKDKTYYWRVDEFDGSVTHRGEVWSLTTIPTIPISNPNLVGWWPLDEGSGSVAVDWSGHDNHGTLVGEPKRVAGQDGDALEFDGTDDFVNIGLGAGGYFSTLNSGFTVAAWINRASAGTNDVIFGAGRNPEGTSAGANNNGWKLSITSGDVITFTTLGVLDYTSSTGVPIGQWIHVAATLNEDGTEAKIYLNGNLAETISGNSPANPANGLFAIGFGATWDLEFFDGMIDDVRVYNKILTAEEITEAMRGDPLIAWGPSPANGSTPDADSALPLTWSPGDNVSQHDVYFGTDGDAVADADTSTADIYRGRQSGTSYTPPEGIEWGGGPYYWRIDEFNTDGSISKGKTWRFTVADFILIDDFESYNAGENQIWYSWHDGLGYGAVGSANYFAGNGTGAAVGDETTGSYTEETIVNSGRQSMPVAYDNNKQGYSKYSEVELTLTAPRNWTTQDVTELSLWFRGYPGSVGSFVEGPVGTYTMTGSGADIWGTADQFHFAFKTLTGAGSIVARVNSVENTNGWAKAGVMIRETLDADSAHGMMVVTPLQGVSFQRRNATGGASADETTGGISAPYWVKIQRDLSGNFTAYSSTNGTTWQMQGTPDNISMGANVYIGLVVVSTNAALTCQAVFTNVTTTGTVGPQWAHQDVGIASNAAEPLYVAISNVAGASAIVTHDDPAAAQIDTWTEWVIPLQALADQGINLADVDRIAIGLGTRGNITTPGGSGKMFFDDIRLYRSREAAE
jgi:hypothetical protein